MATEIILPKLGQTMEEGIIVEWLKKEGDVVARGDVLFQVETDKAVLEVESRSAGVLLKILVNKGVKVPVLTVVGLLGAPGETLPGSSAATTTQAAPLPPAEPQAAGEPPVGAQPSGVHTPGDARVSISPRARKLAAEKGVDMSTLFGTGPGGRIVEQDVLARLAAQPLAASAAFAAPSQAAQDQASAAPPSPAPAMPAAPVTALPLSGLRAIIAERMARSVQTTASVTLQTQADATQLVALRNALRDVHEKRLGFAIGYNDILAVIVARCLVEHPHLNARLEAEGIRQLPDVNLGLAVDSERGLLVPVVHGAQNLRIVDFAVRFRDLVERARAGRALPDELTGGTFTITNLGMFGIDAFTPIINLPECAILGVGRIRPEPAVVDGGIVVRQRLWLSLTFDHRLVDGGPAARFLQAIVRHIETPSLLLI